MRSGLPIYRLKDLHEEEIKGTFYQLEVQKVYVRDDDMWKIEKIMKPKGKGNNSSLNGYTGQRKYIELNLSYF